MTFRIGCLWAFGVTALQAATATQSPAVKYVLSRSVVIADLSTDGRLPSLDTLNASFQSKFSLAFPDQITKLGKDLMIGESDRVIVLLPTITAARVTHEIQGGSIHRFNAVVVGDVSALDPWSGATLYSATRMILGEVTLGQSKLPTSGVELRRAFRVAYDRWLDASIEQLRRDLEPFVLSAATLRPPDKARHLPGGVWPFGSDRGVRTGSTLTGSDGRLAKVGAVWSRFSLIN